MMHVVDACVFNSYLVGTTDDAYLLRGGSLFLGQVGGWVSGRFVYVIGLIGPVLRPLCPNPYGELNSKAGFKHLR